MRLTRAEVWQAWDSDRRKDRRRYVMLGISCFLVFLLCLCFRYHAYNYPDAFIPMDHLKCYLAGWKCFWGRFFDNGASAQKDALIATLGQVTYDGAWARFRETLMACAAGGGLAVAGAIFQTIYRNPMASPNMLGATVGVRLGNILMITLFSAQVLEMVTLRYAICYALTAVCVGGVLLLGKLSGDKSGNPSVLQMVMAGSVLSQGMNVFTLYYMYELEDQDLVLYEELTMGTQIKYDLFSTCLFLGVMALALIPMFALRYRFNIVAMDVTEARVTGINPAPIRMAGQICGVLMVTAAMIHCGDTGMVAMVIPYAVRNRVGADARKVIVFSALTGAILLMVCRLMTSFVLINGAEIPVGFIMNLFLTPAFMMILASGKGMGMQHD